eukprot:gb/GECH01014657.1/.p1 GENE.gb/GECH01014657.1/~~gb/GECH01014657.1/.p1  ORF type:complete len:721 (+),score=135.17 gb/GECH01014657.1/:1-2163(+)
MKFGKRLEASKTPEWATKYIKYKTLKKYISKQCKGRSGDELDNAVIGFLSYIEEELDKTNDFYEVRLQRFLRRHRALQEQVDRMRQEDSRGTGTGMGTSIGKGKRGRRQRRQARRALLAAFQEHYRGLGMLENYRILNYTGFIKIVKKFDKNANQSLSTQIKDRLRSEPFYCDVQARGMIAETEQLVAQHFFRGSRKDAMNKLRVADTGGHVAPGTGHYNGPDRQDGRLQVRTGLWLGLGLILVPFSIFKAAVYLPDEGSTTLPVALFFYRLALFPILLALLFSLNIEAWDRHRLNFRFIFELDPHSHMSKWAFFDISSFLFAMWMLSVYLYLSTIEHRGRNDGVWLPPDYTHLIWLYTVLMIFLALPLRRFHGPARIWLWKNLLAIAMAPFRRVRFAHFFIADQLTSLSKFLYEIQYIFCYINPSPSRNEGVCGTLSSIGLPFLNALPNYWRLMQCLRRFYDTRDAHPHLTNAGKYTSSLIAILMSFIDSLTTSADATWSTGRTLWVIANAISNTYKLIWDIVMDWGLLRVRSVHPFLRSELSYRPHLLYFGAMVLDFVLRFLWVGVVIGRIYANTVFTSEWTVTLVAIAEIVRRFMWNFFRLENEHLNNCGQFRAVKDIPLPFKTYQEDDEDGDEDDGDEDGDDDGEENGNDDQDNHSTDKTNQQYKESSANNSSHTNWINQVINKVKNPFLPRRRRRGNDGKDSNNEQTVTVEMQDI